MAHVLFVCLHNAGRSQMSRALFEKLAGDRHEARSAGTEPAARIHPSVVTALNEGDIDVNRRTPRLLTDDMARWADVVVTMGCGDACPDVRARVREDWSIPDPRDMQPEQFRGVRDLIEASVKALLGRLGDSSG